MSSDSSREIAGLRDGGSSIYLIDKNSPTKSPIPMHQEAMPSDVETFWQSKSNANSGAQASSKRQS
jgi:hypothetical protein